MLCPEGASFKNENILKEEEETCLKKNKEVPIEGRANLDINTYKNPKSWGKSITNFFRNQLRSTKSNDGDRPLDNKDNYEEKDINSDQKWQSLGKMFRRQSFADHCQKTSKHQGESSTQNKRQPVRKVLPSYFGKFQKDKADSNEN